MTQFKFKTELPEFLRADPALWFILCDRIFHRHNIREDDDKVDLISAKLEGKQLLEICDLLRSAGNKYERIKDRIINIYAMPCCSA